MPSSSSRRYLYATRSASCSGGELHSASAVSAIWRKRVSGNLGISPVGGRVVMTLDGTAVPTLRVGMWSRLECSRLELYQLIQRKIARGASARVANTGSWGHSRLSEAQNDSSTGSQSKHVATRPTDGRSWWV